MRFLDWLVIALYFGLLAAIAWWVIRKAKDTPDDYFLQVSGMRFWYDPSLAERPRVVKAWVGGPPLDEDEVYTATLNYGNLLGLEMMFPDVELASEPELVEGIDEFTAVLEFIEDERKLKYGPEGRSVDLSLVGLDEDGDYDYDYDYDDDDDED